VITIRLATDCVIVLDGDQFISSADGRAHKRQRIAEIRGRPIGARPPSAGSEELAIFIATPQHSYVFGCEWPMLGAQGGGRVQAGRRGIWAVALGAATVVLALLVVVFVPTRASAVITGPCSASINGRSVAGLSLSRANAIRVRIGSNVPISMAAHRRMTHYRITLSFAGQTRTIKDRAITANSWADSVSVKRYAQFGRGYYIVRGTSTGPGLSCSGEALVRVG
jgi:hypothetical protein